MTKNKTATKDTTISIQGLKQGKIKLRLIGTTPMFQNRMSNKVKQMLLVGSQKKTKSERAEIKHNPYKEFLDSAEILPDGPTSLGLRVVAVKAAMATAAIETAGLTKAGTQRLLFMPGDFVPLYGTPQLRMDVVRSADINKTPDVRTRLFLPRWGAEIDINYVVPQLGAVSIYTLLANAGILIGVGDFRQEKGKGAFGSFRVLTEDEKDTEWNDLVKNHNRKAQAKALESPAYANKDTEDLMEFFEEEVKRRAA